MLLGTGYIIRTHSGFKRAQRPDTSKYSHLLSRIPIVKRNGTPPNENKTNGQSKAKQTNKKSYETSTTRNNTKQTNGQASKLTNKTKQNKQKQTKQKRITKQCKHEHNQHKHNKQIKDPPLTSSRGCTSRLMSDNVGIECSGACLHRNVPATQHTFSDFHTRRRQAQCREADTEKITPALWSTACCLLNKQLNIFPPMQPR